MSKMKKVLLMCTAYVLVAALAIGGTIAYLTSTDSDVNVMTLGNVKIRQNEYQRVIGSDGLETNELEAFEQGKVMMPYTVRDPKPDDTILTIGDHSVTQDRAKANYIDKIVTVTNTGKSDAYVRTILAIPSGGSAWEPEDTAASETWLHWNTKKAMNDYWHSQWTDSTAYDGFFAEIDGQGYFIYEFTHKTAIAPDYETFPTLVGCYMDNRVNHDDVGYYMDYNTNGKYDDGDKRIEDIEVGGSVEILVISQATQKDGFADPQTALDTSFGDVTAENAAEWFSGMTVKDAWDGTADTSWYSEDETEFTLYSAEQFAGLGELVSEGETFANKTVILGADLDLGLIAEYAYGKEWNWNVNHEPIGTEDTAFKGTFDGQGHVIENAFLNSYIWSNHTNQVMNAIGLFGYVENATIKNVVLKDALAYGEGADFGGIVGKAYGDCSFENISIEGSTIAGYNNGSGGIVGEAGAGNYTFKNIVIAEDTVVGTTNKSFDTAIGGLIGQLNENAKVTFEDITVACRLDAYNDVTASQQYWVYRRCGMLIGSVPTVTKVSDNGYQPDPATQGVVCKNVTVVFGDWADYHYCADSGAGNRYARVEAGYQYAGVDVSTCEDLDEHLNIPFDELFGCQPPVAGAADGISEYTGVTVVNE